MSGSIETQPGWRTIRFEVMEHIECLPSLNNVVLEFLQIARSETAGADKYAAVVSKDQALVARLLKVANSGLFGRSRSVNSIKDATVLVGLENLKRMVYAVSSEGLTLRELGHYDFHVDGGFWRHAMSVAVATRGVAATGPDSQLDPDEAFVTGLLHDTGKLILDDFLTTAWGAPVNRSTETEAVGLDHCELGELILTQWRLPPRICAAVRYSHDWEQAGEFETHAATICLGRAICHGWNLGRNPDPDLDLDICFDQVAAPAARIGLTPKTWDKLVREIRQGIAAIGNMYGED